MPKTADNQTLVTLTLQDARRLAKLASIGYEYQTEYVDPRAPGWQALQNLRARIARAEKAVARSAVHPVPAGLAAPASRREG